MSQVEVFSELPHPLECIVYNDKKEKIGVCRILPGVNPIDREVWEAAKKIPAIAKRLDIGRLRTNVIVRAREEELLRSSASRAFITELTVKSGNPAPDPKLIAGLPSSDAGWREMVLRQQEQIERLTKAVQGVAK